MRSAVPETRTVGSRAFAPPVGRASSGATGGTWHTYTRRTRWRRHQGHAATIATGVWLTTTSRDDRDPPTSARSEATKNAPSLLPVQPPTSRGGPNTPHTGPPPPPP